MARLVGTIGITPFSSKEERLIRAAIGRILPCDDGKRVYEVEWNFYQVENEEQRKMRSDKADTLLS